MSFYNDSSGYATSGLQILFFSPEVTPHMESIYVIGLVENLIH